MWTLSIRKPEPPALAARMPLSASASALRRTMRGSDYYQVGVVPFGRFSYKEYQQYLQFGPNFGSRTYQARLNVMPYEGFELGPMVNYRRGRKHVENNDVNRLPNTDNAGEAASRAIGCRLGWGARRWASTSLAPPIFRTPTTVGGFS